MATFLQRTTPLTAFLTFLLLTSACDAPKPAPPVETSAQGSDATGTGSSGASPTAGSSAPEVVGPAPADLHDVDWTKTPAPGEFCGVPELVRFDARGEARATSTVWGPVHVMRGRNVYYGDTDGDNRDEAALYVGCDDGVTQNAQIAAGYVVYARVGKDLVVIGSITPRQKAGPYPTLLARPEFAPGRIIAHEKWYRPNDAHCCPSGDATTVWTREGSRLTPGEPHITS
ncbi:hypothetical protein [Streptomyces sp. H51]|uniref:hypothetical protein n=1 Tax=Streptomyces sp. H51 TaxID=3111770 RepID=UPI002D77890A|nr:hypothetical protein [Streptomyces sp. H51]